MQDTIALGDGDFEEPFFDPDKEIILARERQEAQQRAMRERERVMYQLITQTESSDVHDLLENSLAELTLQITQFNANVAAMMPVENCINQLESILSFDMPFFAYDSQDPRETTAINLYKAMEAFLLKIVPDFIRKRGTNFNGENKYNIKRAVKFFQEKQTSFFKKSSDSHLAHMTFLPHYIQLKAAAEKIKKMTSSN